MHFSPSGVKLTQAFESCLKPVKGSNGKMYSSYRCPAGVVTIGWGTTPSDVPSLSMSDVWTAEKCDSIFTDSISSKYEPGVNKRIGGRSLKQFQYDALVSFVYNVGEGGLDGQVGKAVREGRDNEVPKYMARWNKAGGRELAGLVRRRKAEGEMWMGDFEAASRTAQTIIPGSMPQSREVPKPSAKELVRETPKTVAALGADTGVTGGTASVHSYDSSNSYITGTTIAVGSVVGIIIVISLVVMWNKISKEWA